MDACRVFRCVVFGGFLFMFVFNVGRVGNVFATMPVKTSATLASSGREVTGQRNRCDEGFCWLRVPVAVGSIFVCSGAAPGEPTDGAGNPADSSPCFDIWSCWHSSCQPVGPLIAPIGCECT